MTDSIPDRDPAILLRLHFVDSSNWSELGFDGWTYTNNTPSGSVVAVPVQRSQLAEGLGRAIDRSTCATHVNFELTGVDEFQEADGSKALRFAISAYLASNDRGAQRILTVPKGGCMGSVSTAATNNFEVASKTEEGVELLRDRFDSSLPESIKQQALGTKGHPFSFTVPTETLSRIAAYAHAQESVPPPPPAGARYGEWQPDDVDGSESVAEDS